MAAPTRTLRHLARLVPIRPLLTPAASCPLTTTAVRPADDPPVKKRSLTELVDDYVVNKNVTAEETVARWPEKLRGAFMEGEGALTQADLQEVTQTLDKLGDRIVENPVPDNEPKPTQRSYWFDADDPETVTHDVEGDKFEENDISPLAHAKLQEIREEREYMRVMAWEMPLLAKYAKPFKPPTAEEVLRFRYTTYLGEEHPAQSKVVVEFSVQDLRLTPVQQSKMAKLAGPRYNPQTHLIKMSCEAFSHQAQNKRYLSDQIDKLIAEAKDPRDTFEDIPLDTRHHKWISNPKWPKYWNLTKKRRAELAVEREAALRIDQEKSEKNLLVDGAQKLDKHLTEISGISPSAVGQAMELKVDSVVGTGQQQKILAGAK